MKLLDRRQAVAGLIAAPALAAGRAAPAAWPGGAPLGPARPFSFDALKAQAQALAARPFRPPPGPPPALVRPLDFDAVGKIAYRPDATLWGDLPGDHGVRCFPLGRYAPTPVAINVVSAGQARPVLYSPALFDAPVELAAAGARAGRRLRRLPGDERRRAHRLDRLPRRVLFPLGRSVQPVRPLGARHGHRHGGGRRRGVPELHRLLAGTGAGRGAGRARAAGWPQRRRRLPHRPSPLERPAWCRTSRPSCISASAWRAAGPRAADQHVLVRPHRPHAGRRLAPADPRLGRPGDLDRRRRAHLAAARRSAAGDGQRLRRQRSARLSA